MKATRFTAKQIVATLHEAAAGSQVRELCRRHGIMETTFYRWRRQYGGLQVNETKRLKTFEDENRRMKKLVADLSLDNAMLKDAAGAQMVTATQRRQVVTHLRAAFDVSARRACRLVGLSRARWHYRSRRPPRDGPVRERQDYNEVRPQTSMAGRTPAEFMAILKENGPITQLSA
jgi:putative transposase